MRDEWRYQRTHGIRERLRDRWESEFHPVTRSRHLERDVAFEVIEQYVGPFLEAVQVREINSATGEVLDYEREPSLKAIAVGGNRLSRGLTLEGLMVSFFIRRSVGYDTLMQMGRWFGIRAGYEDLTRIYTTAELESWFNDLAFVEHRLREDIAVYESQGLTPYQVGMRIWQHPTMQVTSPLKRRFASSTTIAQSYSMAVEQTFKFPLRRLDNLALQAEANRLEVRSLVGRLGAADPRCSDGKGPVWTGVDVERVLEFLRAYRVDDEARSISLPLICAYIERLRDAGELTRWTVAVRGRESRDAALGDADWGLPGGATVAQVSRSRIGETDSVGVITSPGDEAVGLTAELRVQANAMAQAAQADSRSTSESMAARELRPATDGVLLLYPISRYSGRDLAEGGGRRPLFHNPDGPLARDLVGLAISFLRSTNLSKLKRTCKGRWAGGRWNEHIDPQVWTRLANERVQGETLWARRAAPEVTDRLVGALDADGKRHLLVLLRTGEAEVQDSQSRGVGVITRELAVPGHEAGRYLDVTCHDPAGQEAFDLIGGELAERLSSGRETAPECVLRVLAKWRRFWGQLPRQIFIARRTIGAIC